MSRTDDTGLSRPPLLAAFLARAAAAPHRQVVFATMMTALAGFLDAVGYVRLQHLYVSFMSGNSTHFGMSVALAHWSDVLAAGVIVGSFVLGAFAGTLLADASKRLEIAAVLSGEFLIFLSAIALASEGHDHAALVLVAIAMGGQNTLHQIVTGADVGKSFITGMLFGFGQSLAFSLRRRAPIARAAWNLVSWLAFIGGVVIGTLVVGAASLVAVLAVIAGIYALLIAGTCAGYL